MDKVRQNNCGFDDRPMKQKAEYFNCPHACPNYYCTARPIIIMLLSPRFSLAARGPRHGAVRSVRDPGPHSRHLYRGQTQEQASILIKIWTV